MAAPTVDRALVMHVATLASVSLSEPEVASLADDLARIVGYVAQLELVDTTGVAPTAHLLLSRTPLRADEVRPCLPREEVLAQAPQVEADGFAVPTFVE